MNAKTFLDTNIIVYAFSSTDPRSEKAEALLATGGVISIQVLNEFVNVSRRKHRRDWGEIEDALSILKTFSIHPSH
jgi:predicted nucleic acid-binding protein